MIIYCYTEYLKVTIAKCLLRDMYKYWEDTAGSEMNKKASAPLRNLQFCADSRYYKKSSQWIYSANIY